MLSILTAVWFDVSINDFIHERWQRKINLGKNFQKIIFLRYTKRLNRYAASFVMYHVVMIFLKWVLKSPKAFSLQLLFIEYIDKIELYETQ